MNAGMELMGMKECRECGDPYTPAEPDTGVCSCCIMSHEVAALRARVADLERERDEARAAAARLRTLLDENERLKDEARRVRVATLRLAADLEAVTL